MDIFYYPKEINYIEHKIKSSTFKVYIYKINSTTEFKTQFQSTKNKYNNANHVCFAYRLSNSFDLFDKPLIDNYFSDSGEPSGTAGKPILNMLINYKLINTAIFVVRYFGGIKLGIPGLIDAYKYSAEQVIKTSKLTIWRNLSRINLIYSYKAERLVMKLIKLYKCKIIMNNFSEIIKTSIEIDKKNKDQFILILKEKSNGTIQFEE